MAEAKWQAMLQQLKDFKENEGHCLVPTTGGELGRWVSAQRRLNHDGSIASDHKKLLEDVGFIWEVRKRQKKNNDGSASAASKPVAKKQKTTVCCPSCNKNVDAKSVRRCNYPDCAIIGCIDLEGNEDDDDADPSGAFNPSDLGFPGCLTPCENTMNMAFERQCRHVAVETGCIKSPFYCDDHKGSFCIDRSVCRRCIDYANDNDKLDEFCFL